jgi:DNA-binding GntR family transcriptional regulator
MNEEDMKEVQINSLYRFLEDQNVKLETFRDEFAVAIAPDHICETLKIENNSPVLKRIRISSDGDGNVMEYSEGYYNTAKQNYIVTYNEPVQ